MAPITLGSDLLQVGSQEVSHFGDSVGHSDQLVEPLLAHVGVGKDHAGDSSSMLGWGGVSSSDDNFHLREDLASNLGVVADEVESSGSLTIETHDFSERLSNNHLEALVEEVSETFSILVKVSSHEALVSGIEEWIQLVLSADLGNLLPLVESGVDSGWVVSASVEKHARSWGSVSQIFNHTIEIETLSLFVEVSVASSVETSSLEHFVMVSPGWSAHIDGSGSVLSQKLSDDSQCSSSRKGLGRGDSSTGDISVVPAEENLSGSLVENLVSINGRVLFVERLVGNNLSFGGSDNWENVGLSIA